MLDSYDNTEFKLEDIDFHELAQIGITRNQLEENGNMERLLRGEQTTPINLNITMLGVDIVITALLQLLHKGSKAMMLIVGIDRIEQY